MKKAKFDGTTNLEQALSIKPADHDTPDTELIPVDDHELAVMDASIPSLTEPDQEIRDDIAELYDRAVSAFDDNMDQIESMEPKYVSRAMEVSKGYLDMALDAVKLKQRQKEHADKMTIAEGKGTSQKAGTINNNIIVANRNDILRDAMKGVIDIDKSDDTDDKS